MTNRSQDRPDTLFGGALLLHQPARGGGYRVNVDAVLLASFAGEPKRARRAVDLGAGVGSVGLCLLLRDRAAHVALAEVRAELTALAEENLEANGWADRGHAWTIDAREPAALGLAAYDLVVCNPPYVEPGRGRPRAVGQGARTGELAVFTRAARALLARRGRACFVYPAIELATLFEALRASGLEPKRLRLVHASHAQPARVALVEAQPARRGGLVVLPPLVERALGAPSEELARILAPPAHL